MFELIELNMEMGNLEYEMYQDIPSKESGSVNLCNGLSYDVFKNYLESQIARRYQTISYYDTPTKIYILYVDKIPVGYIGLRLELNEEWKKWSGNIFYAVRLSMRGKGYATKMVELAKEEFRKMNYKEIFCNSSANNISSSRVIEKNGGVFLYDDNGSKHYRIDL